MTLLTTHNPARPMTAATAREMMAMFIDQDTDALLVGACLALLAQRAPTSEELAAFAAALSEVAVPFPDPGLPVLDVVGTGGDTRRGGDGSPRATANLSTLAALLLAELGVPVLKHGNRAATGVCGSADLLEGLGLDLNRPAERLRDDLHRGRFAFLFAPAYHPLLGRLREIRRRLGIPTIFNLLGPLLNPGRPDFMVLGVAREDLLLPMAGALAQRGVARAFAVHGKDAEGQGLDEASIEGPTRIVEITGDFFVERAVLVPRELGLDLPRRDALTVRDRADALRLAQGLHGGKGHADFVPALADAVALQAGLGLLLHRGLALDGLAATLREARERLDRGFPLPLPHLLEEAP